MIHYCFYFFLKEIAWNLLRVEFLTMSNVEILFGDVQVILILVMKYKNVGNLCKILFNCINQLHSLLYR